MRSVDTNVVIRLLIRDDPSQTMRALEIVNEGVSVPLTVLLEVAWVLTSRYGLSGEVAADLLRKLIDLPEIAVEAGEKVAWALERFAIGADPADMIHLLASRQATAFVTFDQRLARRAGPETPVPIETLA